MNLDLKDKVVIVAGSSQGLGFATALAFAKEGAKVAICSRDEKRITEAAEKISKETGADVFPMVCDVMETTSVETFVRAVYDHFGKIHACVTNTGSPPKTSFVEASDDMWLKGFNLTFMSAVRLSRACVPYMQKAQWGRIIHLCSITVKNPNPSMLMSNTIRPAIVGLAKSQSNELAKDNILVNSVLSGWINTEYVNEILKTKAKDQSISVEDIYNERVASIPLGRMGKPEEFANAVVFLASGAASFMTGTTLTVDGGEMKTPF